MANFWYTVKGLIGSFSVFDAIDILMVAFLIYQGIKLVKETRAVQLVKGILALLIINLLASFLKLKSIEFLMESLLQTGVVALIVVFQPELRRSLERVGRAKLSSLSVFANAQGDDQQQFHIRKMINTVCESCASLSQKKIGALIVLERDTPLGEIIHTGTILDADPSIELIGNIFFPNSPLHDGAMIIRNAKIYAAGCFLPLSNNMEISREMGTRHRAALGMSENSDALIVVVSEETGKISVAHDSVITRDYTVERLGEELRRYMLGDKVEKKAVPEKKVGFWKVKR